MQYGVDLAGMFMAAQQARANQLAIQERESKLSRMAEEQERAERFRAGLSAGLGDRQLQAIDPAMFGELAKSRAEQEKSALELQGLRSDTRQKMLEQNTASQTQRMNRMRMMAKQTLAAEDPEAAYRNLAQTLTRVDPEAATMLPRDPETGDLVFPGVEALQGVATQLDQQAQTIDPEGFAAEQRAQQEQQIAQREFAQGNVAAAGQRVSMFKSIADAVVESDNPAATYQAARQTLLEADPSLGDQLPEAFPGVEAMGQVQAELGAQAEALGVAPQPELTSGIRDAMFAAGGDPQRAASIMRQRLLKPSNQVNVNTPGAAGMLDAQNRRKLGDEIAEAEVMLEDIDGVLDTATEDLFGYAGSWGEFSARLKEDAGFASEKEKDFLARRQELITTADSLFARNQKLLTGAAASDREREFLQRIFANTQKMSFTQFNTAMGVMRDIIDRTRRIKLRQRAQGLDTAPVDGAQRRGGQAGRPAQGAGGGPTAAATQQMARELVAQGMTPRETIDELKRRGMNSQAIAQFEANLARSGE